MRTSFKPALRLDREISRLIGKLLSEKQLARTLMDFSIRYKNHITTLQNKIFNEELNGEELNVALEELNK